MSLRWKLTAIAVIAAAALVFTAIAPSLFVDAHAVVTQTNRQEQTQSNNQQGAVNVGANVGVQAGNVCALGWIVLDSQEYSFPFIFINHLY